jgi:hypothetical protein
MILEKRRIDKNDHDNGHAYYSWVNTEICKDRTMAESKTSPRSEKSIIPEKIKMDLRTPLEEGFRILRVVAPFFGIGFLAAYFNDPDLVLAGTLGAGLLGLGVMSLILSWFTDNYYIFDVKSRVILYHFQILFFRRITTFAPFSSISSISVGSEKREGQGPEMFSVVVNLRNGDVFPLCDPEPDAWAKMEKEAKKLSAALDLSFDSNLVEKKTPKPASLKLSLKDFNKPSWVSFGIIGVISLISLTYGGKGIWAMLQEKARFKELTATVEGGVRQVMENPVNRKGPKTTVLNLVFEYKVEGKVYEKRESIPFVGDAPNMRPGQGIEVRYSPQNPEWAFSDLRLKSGTVLDQSLLVFYGFFLVVGGVGLLMAFTSLRGLISA